MRDVLVWCSRLFIKEKKSRIQKKKKTFPAFPYRILNLCMLDYCVEVNAIEFWEKKLWCRAEIPRSWKKKTFHWKALWAFSDEKIFSTPKMTLYNWTAAVWAKRTFFDCWNQYGWLVFVKKKIFVAKTRRRKIISEQNKNWLKQWSF